MATTSPTTIHPIDNILHHHQVSIDIINTTLSSQVSTLIYQQSDIAEIKSTLRQLSQTLAEISSKLSSYPPPPQYVFAAPLQSQPDSPIQPPSPTPFASPLSTIDNPTNHNYGIDISSTSVLSKTAPLPHLTAAAAPLLSSSLHTPSPNITSSLLKTQNPTSLNYGQVANNIIDTPLPSPPSYAATHSLIPSKTASFNNVGNVATIQIMSCSLPSIALPTVMADTIIFAAASAISTYPPTTASMTSTHLTSISPSALSLTFHQTPPAQCSTLAVGKVAVKETDSSVALNSEAQPMIQSISKSLVSVRKLTKQATASTQNPHLLPSIHVDEHSNPNTILYFAIDNPKHQQIASDISNNLNKPFRSNFAFPSPKNLLEKLTMDLARSNLADRVSEHPAFMNWENKYFSFRENEEPQDDNWFIISNLASGDSSTDDPYAEFQKNLFCLEENEKLHNNYWFGFLFIPESPIIKSPIENSVPLLQKRQPEQFREQKSDIHTLFSMIVGNKDKLQGKSKILIFDPGGTTDTTSSFDLEDKVDFEGSVMIRLRDIGCSHHHRLQRRATRIPARYLD